MPEVISSKLCGFLTSKDLGALAGANKHWNKLINKQSIWRTQYKQRWAQQDKHTFFNSNKIKGWYEAYRKRNNVEMNWSQGKGTMISLSGHSGSITALQFDKKILLTASDDGSIQKWGLHNHEKSKILMQQHHKQANNIPCKTATFHGHAGPVWCINFQGSLVASGSYDKCIKIWHMNTQNCLLTLRGHEEWVSTVSLNGLHLLSGSWDSSLRIWKINTNLKSASCRSVLRTTHGNSIHCAKWNPKNENIVAAACRHNAVQLWDVEKETMVKTFMGHTKQVYTLQMEANTILSGGGDHRIKMWDQRTGDCVHTFNGHTGSVMTLQHDNNKIVSGGYDKACRIW
eukprot:UN34024